MRTLGTEWNLSSTVSLSLSPFLGQSAGVFYGREEKDPTVMLRVRRKGGGSGDRRERGEE